MTPYQNDYRYMLDVLANRRPARLPVYEHIISTQVMEKVLGVQFAGLAQGDGADLEEYFKQFCHFYQTMTYDTVSFEVCITEILPDHGAILGGRPGPVQTRADFERYPWEELPQLYWKLAEPQFQALGHHLPPGMKALAGVGNGVLEICEDLVGYQYMAFMQADDPQLLGDIYGKIGNVMVTLWTTFMQRHSDIFAIYRFGDDLGFRSTTLVSPAVIRKYILPQYRRVISLIKSSGKPFLWHSCGNIFNIMDEVIALGIDAKHSNEDAIAPFEQWIARFGDRIGLLGGIDVDILCQKTPAEIQEIVFERGSRYRQAAKGYALGSGNSIPDYVPVDGYLAMIEAAQRIRAMDAEKS